jgi:hypothetical protein
MRAGGRRVAQRRVRVSVCAVTRLRAHGARRRRPRGALRRCGGGAARLALLRLRLRRGGARQRRGRGEEHGVHAEHKPLLGRLAAARGDGS